MKFEFGVKCETCGRIFLSPDFQPDKFWYVTAAQHWLNRPDHEIVHTQFVTDKEVDVYCFSEKWRRVGFLNVLKEIQQLKESEQQSETHE